MKWKKPSDELPPENLYVLIHVPSRPWGSEDRIGVFYKVACLTKGISIKERESMSDQWDRKRLYRHGDEQGNNKVPYAWKEFGPGSFFGQEVEHWAYIEYAPNVPYGAHK